MRKYLKKITPLYLLYAIGFVGLILFLIKIFISNDSQFFSSKLVDTILLLLFILLLFVSDKIIRKAEKKAQVCKALNIESQKRLESENKHLKEKVQTLEEKENEALRISSYRDRVMQQISQKKIRDKHNLLHLFAEMFQAGIVILYKETEQKEEFNVEATYAIPEDFKLDSFKLGEGLNGQAAKDGVPMVVKNIPNEYITISSGLGNTKQGFLYLLPIIKENRCIYLIEMLAFVNDDISKIWIDLSNKLVEKKII